jgi:hypothetical protein
MLAACGLREVKPFLTEIVTDLMDEVCVESPIAQFHG